MPMMRRRPVMRTVGRTAVIAGTATVVAGGVNRHQQQKYAQQDAAAQQQAAAQQAAPVEQAPAAAPDSDELISKLKELANLKDQGILTEEEFNDQKAKILAEMS
jgi:type IV secretory pathway VirB9-like protein